MTPRDRRRAGAGPGPVGARAAARVRGAALAVVFALAAAACAGRLPWGQARGRVPYGHAEVETVNGGYRRTSARALVRRVARPTRANLDFAVYHANVLLADPAPEAPPPGRARLPPAPFGGAIEPATLTPTIARTPLSADERRRPLALAPLAAALLAARNPGAAGLDELAAAVRAESWGLPPNPAFVPQTAAEGLLHDPGGGRPVELWVKIEFAPWWRGLGPLDDEDGDGAPELYGRARPDLVHPAAIRFVREEYARRALAPAEIAAWADQLSSLWYPSYNTDLVRGAAAFPTPDTEPEVRAELDGATFPAPAMILRGKPLGAPVYTVLLVDGAPGAQGSTSATSATSTPPARSAASDAAPPQGPPRAATPRPDAVARAIAAELAARGPGATWERWADEVAPYAATVRAHLRSRPPRVMALPGEDGFLFFRRALEMTVAGDLTRQPPPQNPLPALVAWQAQLARRGIDLLFVPVPTKAEVYPDRLDRANARFVGQVVNPWARKFLLDLSAAGVEAIDLWPPLLATRRQGDDPEPLYQRQDTHWTSRGLRLAASAIAARVREYPWWSTLPGPRVPYTATEVPFRRPGDLHARLADRDRRGLAAEALVGHQVKGPDGRPFEPDPESPIVVLGDSYAASYELVDCRHAGVAAHLARELGRPVDLVTSYGGGPNVRRTLWRAGEALARKRLVVYLMTARDLHAFPDGWAPLEAP